MPSFDGFTPATFDWFRGLEEDNSRDWFQAHRDTYDNEVRGPLEQMLTALQKEFGGELKMFRQNRDVRFSHDKSPYKTRAYGLLKGKAGSETGLYAELSADGLYAGTGYHDFAPDQLQRFRQAVDHPETGEELRAILDKITADGLESGYESLKTAPRGYPRDHPRVDLLRHKILIAGRRLRQPNGKGISAKRALDHCTATWQSAQPMNDWLDKQVGPSTVPPRERFGRR